MPVTMKSDAPKSIPKFAPRDEAHGQRGGVPAARHKAPENRLARGFLVDVKGLWIVLLGEGNDRVLSSGIGTTAIQLAAQLGARVFATAGSDEKCAYCESLGAERAINYKTQSFADEIKAATEGRGANVILDMVGGDYVKDNIASAAADGRIVQIAFLKGSKVQIDLMPVMLKRLTLTGSTLRPRTPEFKAHLAGELERKVWPLLENRAVKVVVANSFQLAEAAAAHRLMESSGHMGKIVLLVE